jgi:hypothetical protein
MQAKPDSRVTEAQYGIPKAQTVNRRGVPTPIGAISH